MVALTTKRGTAMALLWTMVVGALAAVVYRLEIGFVAFRVNNFVPPLKESGGGGSVVSRRRGSR